MAPMKDQELKLVQQSDEESYFNSSSSEENFCDFCGADLPKRAKFCPECGQKPKENKGPSCAKKLGFCCCGSFLLVVILLGLSLLFLDQGVKLSVEQVGGFLLGSNVGLEAVSINLASVSVDLQHLSVDSPPKYEDKIFKLDHFEFDVDPGSLATAYMSDFTKPMVLEAFRIVGLQVMINMDAFPVGQNNAQDIVDHMNEVLNLGAEKVDYAHNNFGFDPTGEDFKEGVKKAVAVPPPPTFDVAERAAFARVRADTIRIVNVTAGIRISTLPETTFTLDEVLLTDVGKDGDGVHVYELVEILVRSILMAVIKGAPTSIRSNLARAFGSGLWREMGFAAVHMDLGQGMQDVGNWMSWVGGESAQLNTRLVTEGAEMSAKAASMGVKMNGAFITEGAKLAGMAASAQLKASGAGMAASAKATAMAAKMQSDLTTAFTPGGMARVFR